MISKSDAVLFTILAVGERHQKKYSWPSQKTILRLIKKHYNFTFSRRTLNRILLKLENHGWIERTRRHRKSIFGGIVFCSTLYKLKGKVFNWLYSLGNRIAWLYKFYRVPFWAQHKSLKRELGITFPSPDDKKAPFFIMKVHQQPTYTS